MISASFDEAAHLRTRAKALESWTNGETVGLPKEAVFVGLRSGGRDRRRGRCDGLLAEESWPFSSAAGKSSSTPPSSQRGGGETRERADELGNARPLLAPPTAGFLGMSEASKCDGVLARFPFRRGVGCNQLPTIEPNLRDSGPLIGRKDQVGGYVKHKRHAKCF